MMTERPILFSGPMVRAIMDGRKTMTRRMVKSIACAQEANKHGSAVCPYGQPGGSRIWVKETWRTSSVADKQAPSNLAHNVPIWFEADGAKRFITNGGAPGRVRQSIFMPRWASRITLEVTGARVERLQDISEDDAEAEGVDAVTQDDVRRNATWSKRQDFAQLWDKINAKRAPWESNPWVWVISFKRI